MKNKVLVIAAFFITLLFQVPALAAAMRVSIPEEQKKAALIKVTDTKAAVQTVSPWSDTKNKNEIVPQLSGKTVVIDPGHGGSDPGAIGASGIKEKDVTLAISGELRKLLEKTQSKVVMTRNKDEDVYGAGATDAQELQARVNIAKQAKADLAVSIHIDSYSSASARGTTTYYLPKSSRHSRLARTVQSGLTKQIGLPDRGFRQENFYILKHLDIPAILVEVAFISNPTEEHLLKDPQFISKAAYGIFAGIKSFFAE